MSNEAKRHKRLLAGVLAGAMALSVTPILGFTGVAGADHIEVADPIGDGNVCEDAPETDPFTDVSDTDPAVDEIRCMANTDPAITQGTSATTYSPNESTKRGQMALFLVRLADLAEANETSEDAVQELPAGDGTTPFTDISDWPAEHQSAIDRLEEAGITEGVTATEFRPNDPVSRRQMAKFLVRLQQFLAGEDFPPTPSEDYFDDDNGDSGEAELNILAEEGVFIGTAGAAGEHNVQPGEDITRRQMAFVVTRKLEVLFEAGLINRLFAEDDTNQAFAVAPAATQTDTTAGSDGFLRFTFSGLDPAETYDVGLLPCADTDDRGSFVFSSGQPLIGPMGDSRTGGIISFLDQDGGTGGQPDDLADGTWGTEEGDIDIRDIDGDAVNEVHEDEVSPRADGTIEVDLIGAADESDCGIAVLFNDADDDDELDLGDNNEDTLENDNVPTEMFAVSSAAVFHEGPAAAGSDWCCGETIVFMGDASLFPGLLDPRHDVGVVLEDEDTVGSLIGLSFTDDRFYLAGDELEGGPTTAEYIQAVLTIGDELELCDGDDFCNGVDNTYQPGSRTHWSLWDDDEDVVPDLATNVTVTVSDTDGDGDADDITATWDSPVFGSGPGGHIDSYDIEVYNAANPDAGPVATASTPEANNINDPDAAANSIVITDLGPGTYRARVAPVTEAEDDTQMWSLWSEPFDVVAVGAPLSVATATNDAGPTPGQVDAGDILTVTFDQAMAAVPADDVITLQDADGTTCTYSDAGASAFVYSDEDATAGTETLTITVGAPDTCTAAGTVGGLQYPATVIASDGIVDADDGFEWNLEDSPDRTFE